MEFIEIIGWVATILILISFMFEGMKLRVINTIGAVVWLYYGYEMGSSSIMFLNGTLIGIQSIKIYQIRKRQKSKDKPH
jgi:hypothetical protein